MNSLFHKFWNYYSRVIDTEWCSTVYIIYVNYATKEILQKLYFYENLHNPINKKPTWLPDERRNGIRVFYKIAFHSCGSPIVLRDEKRRSVFLFIFQAYKVYRILILYKNAVTPFCRRATHWFTKFVNSIFADKTGSGKHHVIIITK